jgi:hypothetical protein
MKQILLVVCLLPACAGVGVTQLKDVPSREPDCKLDVYTEAKEVTRPVEAVCLLDAHTSARAFTDRTISGAIELAKPEACKCGADALILMSGRSEGANMTNGQGFATLKAVRYTDGVAH